MANLVGEFRHTIDDKGRLTLPARIRDELGPVFMVTKGLEGCLFLYPMSEWETLSAKLRDLPLTQRDARALARLVFAGASDCRPDAQGRILLPPPLRQFAGLTREGVIVGVSARAEVWQPEAWDRYVGEAETGYADIAERLGALGG